MIKKGFTLAEVLIALAIIGVVAAVTLPSLITDTTAAQIGPKLAKAASTFEQANQALLDEYDVDAILDTGLITTTGSGNNATSDTSSYIGNLTNHMKASKYTIVNGVTGASENSSISANTYSANTTGILSADGTIYSLHYNPGTTNNRPHKHYIGEVIININGEAKPNEYATDVFAFGWYNDGSLRPVGGNNWKEGANTTDAPVWTDKCTKDTTPSDPTTCAGHVFENNLKVLYK